MRAITIDGALTEAWTSERLVVLLGSVGQRRAIHLRVNRSSVAYTMCITGLHDGRMEFLRPTTGLIDYRNLHPTLIRSGNRRQPQNRKRSDRQDSEEHP